MKDIKLYLTRKQIEYLYQYGTIYIKRNKHIITIDSKFRVGVKCKIKVLERRLKTLKKENKSG